MVESQYKIIKGDLNMTTRDMIEKLRNGEAVNPNWVASRLEELMMLIDDMRNDHYVDMLDWYCEKYLELEEKLGKVAEVIAAD